MSEWKGPATPEQVEADVRDLLFIIASALSARDSLDRDNARQYLIAFRNRRREVSVDE